MLSLLSTLTSAPYAEASIVEDHRLVLRGRIPSTHGFTSRMIVRSRVIIEADGSNPAQDTSRPTKPFTYSGKINAMLLLLRGGEGKAATERR